MGKSCPAPEPRRIRTVGENAFQKVVRLLNSFNQRNIPEGSEAYIDLILEKDGGGKLVFVNEPPNGAMYNRYDVFGFESPETLMAFFEAGPLEQMRMVAQWAAANND